MEKSSSLFHFLMKQFGTYFGVLLLAVSCFYYFHENTNRLEVVTLSMLQENSGRIELAGHSSQQFLTSGKSKDLDDYNKKILQIGQSFNDLAVIFKNFPEYQKKFSEVQKKSRVYFLAVNDRLEKKQNGKLGGDRAIAASSEEGELTALLEGLTKDIRENSLQPLTVFGQTFPQVLWYFWAGMILACYCILMSAYLQKKTQEDQAKDISDLKIQSILLDGVLNSISEALVVVDEHGHFTRYNTAAQRIIGNKLRSISSEEDARDFGFFDIASLQQLSLKELPFARSLKGEQIEDLEILVHNESHPEGIYISISSRFLRDIDGSIRGALAVFRDISRRKAIEQEWIRARESALETARKKSDFLAAMSHEIRTPMNGVMGMSTLLAETPLTEEQKDYVGTIKRSAQALLRLINDILDHSKIEAGKVQINPRPFDLKILCEDVMDLFAPAVREKNIGLDLKWQGRNEWNFVGDPERIRQVLVNLIGNAVKFTEKGSVRVQVEALSSYGNKSQLKLSVIDTGAGFSEEEGQFLFQKYFQTSSGIKYGGTGLGLSICHQLIELMGGKIGLQSKPGLGSTFWFNIELAETTADQIPAQKEQNFAAIFKGHVLLAEDQPVNQRVATTYLQKLGLDVDVANNGQVAVEKALQKSYDLIFMDCQMPVMTGYEATRKIRELQTGVRTPIVALTAEGTSGEKESCMAAGMDDFLTKPLELDRLTSVLHQWLKTSGPVSVLDEKALEKLRSYVVNNKSLTEALIEDFAASAPALLTAMKNAFEQGQVEEIRHAAHALKSTSATLGATGLDEICQSVEDMENLEKIKPLLTSIDDQLNKSLQELLKYKARAAA